MAVGPGSFIPTPRLLVGNLAWVANGDPVFAFALRRYVLPLLQSPAVPELTGRWPISTIIPF